MFTLAWHAGDVLCRVCNAGVNVQDSARALDRNNVGNQELLGFPSTVECPDVADFAPVSRRGGTHGWRNISISLIVLGCSDAGALDALI